MRRYPRAGGCEASNQTWSRRALPLLDSSINEARNSAWGTHNTTASSPWPPCELYCCPPFPSDAPTSGTPSARHVLVLHVGLPPDAVPTWGRGRAGLGWQRGHILRGAVFWSGGRISAAQASSAVGLLVLESPIAMAHLGHLWAAARAPKKIRCCIRCCSEGGGGGDTTHSPHSVAHRGAPRHTPGYAPP